MSEGGTAEPVDILIVEDNPGDIRLTREAFKEGKIANTLHVVENGVNALDFLFQRNEYADAPRPDLVLLDLNLPRKNGDEVLEELHEDPDRRSIPVIILRVRKLRRTLYGPMNCVRAGILRSRSIPTSSSI